jgi:hypothetical protein
MKKMILVPEVMLDTITRKDQQHSTAELDQVVRLDREIERLLNRKDLSLQQKASMYNDIVQQYLHFRKEARDVAVNADRGELRMGSVDKPFDKEATERQENEFAALAQASLPRSYQHKGQQILSHLRDSGAVSWSPTTHELIYNGEPITGTNISDLLYYATVPNKRAAPSGATEFLSALRAANVPRIYQRTDIKLTADSTPVQTQASSSAHKSHRKQSTSDDKNGSKSKKARAGKKLASSQADLETGFGFADAPEWIT